MEKRTKYGIRIFIMALSVLLAHGAPLAQASSSRQIDAGVMDAYKDLLYNSPGAKALAEKAKGVLVFPGIVKGGFIVGGQYGNGALIQEGKINEYYNSTAVSYGLQAGVEKFGYALFFMSEEDLDYLRDSGGWELGSNSGIVIVDKGLASSLSTTTVRKGVFAFFFDQKGLMAGLGLQGAKITRIYP